MGKKKTKTNKTKQPIDILKAKIVSDAMVVLLLTESKRINMDMYNIFQVLLKLVRKTEMLDNVTIDINSMIGLYMDDIKFVTPNDYFVSIGIIKKYIDEYQQYCKDNNLESTYNNFQKIKDYKEDNSIYG